MFNRAWVICNSSVRFHEEVAKLKDIFIQNGYSDGSFKKQVKRFLGDKYNNVSESIDESEKAVEKTYLLMIPCLGKPSLIFKQKMSELVKEMYDVKLKCVFTSFKVEDYFPSNAVLLRSLCPMWCITLHVSAILITFNLVKQIATLELEAVNIWI